MSLVWYKTPSELKAHAAANATMLVTPIYQGPFAYVNDAWTATGTAGPREDIQLASARIFKVSVSTDEYITAIICRMSDEGTPEWTLYCGDKQVSGSIRDEGKRLAAALRTSGKFSTRLFNSVEASPWVELVPDPATCGFINMLRRTNKYCSHTAVTLHGFPVEEFTVMAAELGDWLTGKDTGPAVPKRPMSPEELAFFDAAFIQHVLLAGERGSGKTYLGRSAADDYDAVYLEMQMHPSMEPWEFRAHDRMKDGKPVEVLGKLAEAVYWIQKGKKVVLCMDEFLNMNPMYTTTINSPLSLTANDTYLVETGRIIDAGDGQFKYETVEVPSDMLWVVATTNIGARYGLDKMPPSVRARFLIILMNTNPERTKMILETSLREYSMPIELGEKFSKFIKACNQAVIENTMDEEATTRLACNVIRAVHKKAVRDKKYYKTLADWLPVVKLQLMAEQAQVVSFETGPLDPLQASRFKSLVDMCFK